MIENEEIRLFPIGSLRVGEGGGGNYFEIFAKPVTEGTTISFLAVDINPLFWLRSLVKGRFSHPPALRLRGVVGQRRESTPDEQAAWHRKVHYLLKTKGGKALWSRVGKVRELQLTSVRPVQVGTMTKHLKCWGLLREPEKASRLANDA